MGNVTNNLNLIVQVVRNSDNSQVMNNNISLSFDSNVAQGLISLALTNGLNVIPLPQTLCYQLYVRNTSQSTQIQAEMTTPSTGGMQTICTIYPGDVITIWQNPSVKNGAAGFSALSLFAIGDNCFCEYFIGG